MESIEALVVLFGLTETNVEGVDRDGLVDTLKSVSELRGWLDRFELTCVRQNRRLSESGCAEPAEFMLSRLGKRSSKETKTVTDREQVGEQMGGFEDALGDGAVSAGHLDAIAAAVGRLDDDLREEFRQHEQDLLKHAGSESVDVFGKRCRRLARQLVACRATSDAAELDAQREQSCVKRWVDKITGMHHTHLELDPVRDANMRSIIDAQISSLRHTNTQIGSSTKVGSNTKVGSSTKISSTSPGGGGRMSWNELQVEAFTASVSQLSGNGDSVERRIPEITVLIDFDTLMNGLSVSGVCETDNGVPLPVSTVRRMCCDAEVLPVVLGGDGEALDVGRSQRTANRAQRRALRAMYSTCAHPDCGVGFSACRIHHIRWWWEHHGLTDLDNLLPLCEKHHHQVHEGGWKLSMDPDRATTWATPNGITRFTATLTKRKPDNTLPAESAARQKPDRGKHTDSSNGPEPEHSEHSEHPDSSTGPEPDPGESPAPPAPKPPPSPLPSDQRLFPAASATEHPQIPHHPDQHAPKTRSSSPEVMSLSAYRSR